MEARFEAGRTYNGQSPCDSDVIIRVAVISRTAKTIRASTDFGLKTLRIREYEGREQVMPWGSYSMAPVVCSSQVSA